MSNYKRYFSQLKNPVFITVVTKNRQQILIDNIELLKDCLKNSMHKFNYKFIAGIIMPDHFHILIYSEKPDLIPKIIHDIKYSFSKNITSNVQLTESEQKRGDKGIWQRRYYDHIIRDENDLNRHLDYIHYNSMKHLNIEPKNWKCSSFHKFVKNSYYEEDWCNFNDRNDINNLELE